MKKTITLVACMVLQVGAFAFSKGQPSKAFKQATAPLGFEENKGQITDQYGNARQDIQYTLKAPGLTVFIGNGSLHYQFYRTEELKGADAPVMPKATRGTQPQATPTRTTTYRMDVNLANANIYATPAATGAMEGVNHYYTNPQQKDGAAVRSYQKITYPNIYPGIDWVLYVQNNGLKYDFVVHPGANAADIQLGYKGDDNLALQKDGSIRAATPYGAITEHAPVAYQSEDRKAIASGFQQKDNNVSFAIKDAYQGTLVIDPGVVWATYYGEGNESGSNVACDPSGYIYIQGTTSSTDNIATTGSYQDTLTTDTRNIYIAKFDSLDNRLWATYYSVTTVNYEFYDPSEGFIACDATHVYLGGTTSSTTGIATPGAHQDTLTVGGIIEDFFSISTDAFLIQFDSAGVRQWGTYYGGNGLEIANGVTCGPDNTVYLYGHTASTNGIATPGSHQDTLGPCVNCVSYGDAVTSSFLAQFNSAGVLQWGTYYGDGNGDYNSGICTAICDQQGNIDFLGRFSPDPTVIDAAYATPGTFEPNNNGNNETYIDAFVVQMNSSGVRNWGTFYHSTDPAAGVDNFPYTLTCDKANHIYIGGSTDAASGIATPGSYIDYHPNGQYSGFITQFNATNGQRNWATYYPDQIDGMVCDPGGYLYIAGFTIHPNDFAPYTNAFATPYSYQDSFIAAPALNSANAFVGEFDSSGNRHWGTYFGGGNESSFGNVLAADLNGNIYLAATTTINTNIATPGSFQDTLGTLDTVGVGLGYANNAFLVRFAPIDVAINSALVSPVNDTVCIDDASISVTLQNRGHLTAGPFIVDAFYTYYDNSTGIGDTSTATTTVNSSLIPGATTVVTLGGLTLHPGIDTVLIYLQHVIDDSSFVDDTLYAVVYAIAAPTVASINATNTDSLYSFSANNAQNVTSYQWSFGDGNTATGASVSHLYAASGNYTVTLIASNSCKSDTVTTNVSAIGLGIANINSTANISIYPNPAQQTLNIQVPAGLQATELSIINTVGAKVYTEKVDVQNATKSLNVHGLSDGYYILKVNTNQGYYNVPFEILN